MHQYRIRAAWLRLAHAFPAEPSRMAALRSLEPELPQLGERLAELMDGDDSAFDDSLDTEHPGLSRRFVTRLRSSKIAAQVERAELWAQEKTSRHLLTPADTPYPFGLQPLCDAPPMLAVLGQLDALHPPGVAMVGARAASRVGLATARSFARELSEVGFSVVSGLAIGIDAAAHQGALDANGVTLAVSATGPDRIYPARHAALARKIVQRGAILSEYPLGEGVHRRRFPERNRLIAALGFGVVVVEAGRRSGTLTTANHASELGKPVMPVPGSIANRHNGGSHDLIREGASLVESTRDIIDLLSPAIHQELHAPAQTTRSDSDAAISAELDAVAQLTLTCLDADAVEVDTVCNTLALPPRTVLSALSRLELAGLAERLPGGGYARCLR